MYVIYPIINKMITIRLFYLNFRRRASQFWQKLLFKVIKKFETFAILFAKFLITYMLHEDFLLIVLMNLED